MKYVSSLMLCLIVAASMSQENYRLLIGTYTSGKSEGIYLYDFNLKTGTATLVSVTKGIANPSYLAVSSDQKYVYAVSELNGGGNAGQVYAYAYNKANGELTFINKQPSGGDDPCYVSVSRNGKWVIAGNYSSGSLKALRSSAGRLYDENKAILHEGKGLNPERQEKPHVHATYLSPDNKTLYVPDLGIDQVMVYRFDSYSGQLTRKASVPVEPGSGPRHIDIHPNGKYAYLMEELKGNISVFSIDHSKGTLTRLQTISSAAEGFTGDMGSADIHICSDGRFVYASNRGNANDIAIFSVDPQKGTLTKVGNQPVLGIAPRNFTLDPSEHFLLVANMKSDEIVVFSRDKTSGKLTDTGKRISVPTPVCLKWIAK
jgi:6-phosphogluconolactonase